MNPPVLKRRADICPHFFREKLVDLGFAWLGAEIGMFVDIRFSVPGRYFTAIRDAGGRVLRAETLAGLKAWRADLPITPSVKEAAA